MSAAHILVVDDEADIRDLVSGVLEDEGYSVRSAADSTAALDAIDDRRPSLVLLDVWLQGSKLDGLQLLEQIKKDNADLPIVMVATKDIGAKAAELLDRLDFGGKKVVEFQGPGRVTMKDATAVLGMAIGMPDLPYVQVSYGDAEKAMLGTGMKPSLARLMIEMTRAFNDGRIEPLEPSAPDRQGRTRIEEFAQTFVKAYLGA